MAHSEGTMINTCCVVDECWSELGHMVLMWLPCRLPSPCCDVPLAQILTVVCSVVVAQVGYPLVTVLVCLVDVDNYARQVESMADFLVKQMKVKEYR